MIRYTPAVQQAGETTITHANNIRRIGADMYAHLNQLVSSGQLTGDGIATELQNSQRRWNEACDAFAQAEEDFGNRTIDASVNAFAADAKGGSYF
jgi:hypothetical protein